MKNVFIKKFNDSDNWHQLFDEAAGWIGLKEKLNSNSKIIIKPNFTWKEHIPGITVTPLFIENLVKYLLNFSNNIIIVEAEGGKGCFKAEDAFKNHGIYDLVKRHNIKAINLTKVEKQKIIIKTRKRLFSIELPTILLNENDILITVPVPKVHAMTQVSMGFKNQWGCIPEITRFRYHPYFSEIIIQIAKLINIKWIIFDGTYFLNRQGPMAGESLRKDLIIASNNLGAGSISCCKIMGIDPKKIKHFHEAYFHNLLDFDDSQI